MAVDVNRLREECVYESHAPLEALADDLAQIESLAAEWRAAWTRLLISGIVAIAAGFIVLAFFYPAGLALIAIGIYLFVRMKRSPRAVANHIGRCEFVKSVAGMLALDTEVRTPAVIRLAFNPQRELLSEDPWPNRKNGRQRLYKTSWLSLETTLCDGTTFTETIDDLVRERSFTNPRGKSKTKSRTHSLLGMRLAYSQKVYGDATPLSARMQKEIQLPSASFVRAVETTGRIVKVKALVTQYGDLARTSSMLALGVYRMLNLSRDLEARKRALPKTGDAP